MATLRPVACRSKGATMDEHEIQHMQDDLITHADYMKTVASATHRLHDAVNQLLDSLPESTRADLARRLMEEQAAMAEAEAARGPDTPDAHGETL